MRTFLLTFLLCCHTLGWGADRYHEFKFSITDLEKIPQEIRDALIDGSNHTDIVRRGIVVQKYAPLTQDNIAAVIDFINRYSSQVLDHRDVTRFLSPGYTREIRLIHRFLKNAGGEIVETKQIGLGGGTGTERNFIETPAVLDAEQKVALDQLFGVLVQESVNTVHKIHFELCLSDIQHHTVVENAQGNPATVEIDIITRPVDGAVKTRLAVGEVRQPQGVNEQLAARFASTSLSIYMDRDISSWERARMRQIALHGVPEQLQQNDNSLQQGNDRFTRRLVTEFADWIPDHLIKELITEPESRSAKTNKKVLLNAEAFGFGPSAAIAEVFPYLRESVTHLAYIGENHTLNLQTPYPYDALYDCTVPEGASADLDHDRCYTDRFQDYDVFVTASDFRVAELAKRAGLEVILYDPLTWFWRDIPETVAEADLYLAQNFMMVEERIRMDRDRFPSSTVVVPPILSGLQKYQPDDRGDNLLVNTGGLMNPFLAPETMTGYAGIIMNCVQERLVGQFSQSDFIGSRALSAAYPELNVKTLSPEEVQSTLQQSSIALMTSGLGNIYEAANLKSRVVWLPPANDSQGQQLRLLQRYGMIDANIDWHDIFPDEEPVDYFSHQPDVMRRIARRVGRLTNEVSAQRSLCERITEVAEQLSAVEKPSIAKLAERFSNGGSRVVADEIVHFLEQP